MVPVGLAVGRDVDELRALRFRGEAGDEPFREKLAVREEVAEGEIVGDRAVVEKERDRPARGQAAEVGLLRIDPFPAHVPPLAADRPDPGGLAGGQDREQDALGGHDVERLEVDRRLREPHPLGPAAEAVFEVADAPEDLGPLVAARGERHDEVVIGLGHGRPVAAEAGARRLVGLEDGPVGPGVRALQPGEERRPGVERDRGVVVDDRDDAVPGVEDARGRVGRVALGRDALVPVVVGRRRILDLDLLEPGVLPRRLVEVAVDADEAVHICLLKTRTPSGGRVRRREWLRPWSGSATASTAPRLPRPWPPYSLASLLRISFQGPPAGTPTR